MTKPLRVNGFTLIEVIVGIVVLAIALVLITSIIVPTARQSVTPVYQMRAAELGQARISEIMSRRFEDIDEFNNTQLIKSADGTDLANIYQNFQLQTTVAPSSLCAPSLCKQIVVIVTTPEGQELTFSAIRGNF